MVTTNSTGVETCDGDCSDAGYYHNFADDGAHKCDDVCRRGRFEGRCHCGRKYAIEKHVDPEMQARAESFVKTLSLARRAAAHALDTEPKNITLMVHQIYHPLWDAIESEANEIGAKSIQSEGRIIFLFHG